MSDAVKYRCIEVLETLGCDAFEIGLLPVLRHLCVSSQAADPKSWSRAFDIAVERHGEAIGLPAAHGLNKVVLALFACREEGLDLQEYEIDHIVPRSVGGVDHPHNYAMVPRHLNRQWAGNWHAAKRSALGPATVRQALDFAQWSAAQSTVPYGAFVPGRPRQPPCTFP